MSLSEQTQNKFENYFGKIPNTVQTHEDPYQHETHNLPEAYLGKNRFLMGTFDYLITKEGREFLTKVILPFEHTDNINVAWEVFHFDKTIADVEPEQGMPRYVTQKHDMYADTLTRRGLAFIIEHGFYTTPIGKKHYLMNIQQIVDAVSDTCSYQVIRALLDCEDHYSNVDSEMPRDIIRRELSRFGIVQRGEHGMHILDSDLKDAMNREGIRPNTYIFPARMSSYIRMRDPYMTEHSRGGVGVGNLGEDPSALTFRGTRVYECRYFETDYIEQPFDPLEQTIVYNEYYYVPYGQTGYAFSMKQDNWVRIAESVQENEPDDVRAARKGLEVLREAAAKKKKLAAGASGASEALEEESKVDGLQPSFTPFMFQSGQFRRFSEKTYSAFNDKYFAPHTQAVQEAVSAEVQIAIDQQEIIRPKMLNALFEKHTQSS